jgi:predicted GNAT family N-acyltransferase
MLAIKNSKIEDLEFSFFLYAQAIAYQKTNGHNLWPTFPEELIRAEIREKRHWKVLENNSIACVFSVMYNDPVIWGEKDEDPAVYLHRIAVNPLCRGKGMMRLIKDWAIGHARQQQKKFVRMDTWGSNKKLREYYISCGFNYLGQQFLKEEEQHYGGSELSLFQIDC